MTVVTSGASLRSLREFLAPVRPGDASTLPEGQVAGLHASGLTLLASLPLVWLAETLDGTLAPAWGALFYVGTLAALGLVLAASLAPSLRSRPEPLLFLCGTVVVAWLLLGPWARVSGVSPFAPFAPVVPLGLSAFAPLRPLTVLLIGLEVALLYPLSIYLGTSHALAASWVGMAFTALFTTMAAAACQVQRRRWADLDRARAHAEATRQTMGEQVELLERYAADLESARNEALLATRTKSEFLANMSHEIRTPMTAILGFTELLLEQARRSDAELRTLSALDTIHRNGEHLLEVINGILDLSKIEAGKLTVESIPCSPPGLVADVASLMRPRAFEKGLELIVEFPEALPATIRSDPTRLRQILINLVGNAIKFTDRGSVTMRIGMATEPGADNPRLYAEVEDTGIGLSDRGRRQIFEAFSQADGSMTRRFGGTGLGLTISRRLTQLMGGDIEVRSTPGEGSLFRAEFATGPLIGIPMRDPAALSESLGQLESAPAADRLGAAVAKLHGSVLLAEDGPDNQRLISTILRRVGLEVQVAENGRVACELALEARDAGRPFDVILMDMQMPELDGYAATERLRDAGYDGAILALTAHAMAGDREKCLEIGCDEYLTKPIRKALLLRKLGHYLGKGEPQT